MTVQEQTRVERGDVIEVGTRRVGETGRVGEILDVLGAADHPHYRVRWDDGHESVFYPGGDSRIRKASAGRPRPTPQLDLAETTRHLTDTLREAGTEFELLPHRRTSTAENEARVLGVLPQTVAKTVIVRLPEGGFARAVIPASSRLDLGKLAAALGVESVTLLAEPDLVAAYPPFELGAVPPFGGPVGDRVVVDRRLAECDHVVLDAGVHDTSLRLRTEDLVSLADAQLDDIARG